MRIRLSNEFKIGVAAIVAIVVLVVGIQYLKGINMLRQGRYYHIVCSNVEGLNVSSHVMLDGYQVGLVREMHYDYAGTGKVVVLINVEDGLKLSTDSHARVVTDLLGTASIQLTRGTAGTLLAAYDTIPGGEKAAGLTEAAAPLMGSVGQLLPKLDTLIAGLNVLVCESRVHESLLDAGDLIAQLNTAVERLNGLLASDVPRLMENANATAANLEQVSADLKDADLTRLLTEASQAIGRADTLLAQAQNPGSTLGKLTTGSELHDQLTAAIGRIDSLVADVQQNPKRYINIRVFGK